MRQLTGPISLGMHPKDHSTLHGKSNALAPLNASSWLEKPDILIAESFALATCKRRKCTMGKQETVG